MVLELLQDMLINDHLIAAEHKSAVAIIKKIETSEIDDQNDQLHILLNPTQVNQNFFSLNDISSFFCRPQMLRLNRLLFPILLNK